MKKLIALFILIGLFGCTSNEQPNIPSTEMHVKCFSGVLYYFGTISEVPGYKGFGFMAPVYNTKGQVVLCTGTNDTYDK